MPATTLTPVLHPTSTFVPDNHHVAFLAVSGSHAYGFPSPDSDVDLRGIHIATRREALGLFPPPDTHEWKQTVAGVLYDGVTYDIKKALHLIQKGNGNLLECVFATRYCDAPTWIIETIRPVVQGLLSRRITRHYLGFSTSEWLEVEQASSERVRVKKVLYTFRTLLTGLHLLRTGTVVVHLPTLLDQYPIPGADHLIAAKQHGGELVEIPLGLTDLRAVRDGLIEKLRTAEFQSTLPPEPSAAALTAADDLIVILRG